MSSQASYKTSILITGGTQGMGYDTARLIAEQRPDSLIILASRTNPNDAATSVNKALNQSNVTYTPLDLSTRDAVRTFVDLFVKANHPAISHLLLNAAVQFWDEDIVWGTDGIEKQIAVNHVGHTLLYHLLSSHNQLTPDARVVITSSSVHDPAEKWGTDPEWTSAEYTARPSNEEERKKKGGKGRNGMDRYSTSKVANVLWLHALARRFQELGSSKTVVAFDPGLMPGTGLIRNAPAFIKWLVVKFGPTLVPLMRLAWRSNIHRSWESAENLAWIAVSEEAKGMSGVYFEEREVKETSVVSRDAEMQEDLWRWTVEFVSKDGEEKADFDRGV